MISKAKEVSKVKNDIRGCIDLGSSYFRLLILRAAPGGNGESLTFLQDERRFVGWGRDLEKDGKIGDRAVETASAVLDELIGISRSRGCSDPRIVATNTLRSAANSGEVLSRLDRGLPSAIIVLSVEGEAALGFLGASTALAKDEDILLVDPGGTSTEMAWGRGGIVRGYTGVPLGVHSIASMIARGGGGSPAQSYQGLIRRALAHARIIFERLKAGKGAEGGVHSECGGYSHLPPEIENYTIVFTGGTAISLALVGDAMRRRTAPPPGPARLTSAGLDLVGRRLAGLFLSGRERSLPLQRERIDLIVPGLVLIEAVTGALGIDEFMVVTRDLRWGTIAIGEQLPRGYRRDE